MVVTICVAENICDAQLPLRPRCTAVPLGLVMRGYGCAMLLGSVGTSAYSL